MTKTFFLSLKKAQHLKLGSAKNFRLKFGEFENFHLTTEVYFGQFSNAVHMFVKQLEDLTLSLFMESSI